MNKEKKYLKQLKKERSKKTMRKYLKLLPKIKCSRFWVSGTPEGNLIGWLIQKQKYFGW